MSNIMKWAMEAETKKELKSIPLSQDFKEADVMSQALVIQIIIIRQNTFDIKDLQDRVSQLEKAHLRF